MRLLLTALVAALVAVLYATKANRESRVARALLETPGDGDVLLSAEIILIYRF